MDKELARLVMELFPPDAVTITVVVTEAGVALDITRVWVVGDTILTDSSIVLIVMV